MFLGISGVAGSGKDLFVQMAINRLNHLGIKAKRYSLADGLKREIAPVILESNGFDPLTCTREQKESIRPLLVSYAKQKRDASNGRYWLEKLEKEMNEDIEQSEVCLISDIRYAEYPKDEASWLKKEKAGLLVHVSKFHKNGNEIIMHRPANEEELRNDPVLNKMADYRVCWEHGDKYLESFVVKFVDWLRTRKKI